MSTLKGSWYLVVDCNNQTGSSSVTINSADANIVFPAGTLRACASLISVNHSDKQNSFAADCFISSYRDQNGVTHGSLYQPFLLGNNIESVKVTVNVNGCDARGVCVIDVF